MDFDLEKPEERHAILKDWKNYLPRLDSVLGPPPDVATNWYNIEQDEEEHEVRKFLAVAWSSFLVPSDENVDEEFRILAKQWHEETTHMSSVARKIAHPSYREIIKLGGTHRKRILSLILKDLRRKPAFWFAALETISGEHPVTDRADPNKERQIWLNWGKQQEYL